MTCSHPPNSIRFVEENFFTAVCECVDCGERFDVEGWGVRGAGKVISGNAKRGFISGGLNGALKDVFGRKK